MGLCCFGEVCTEHRFIAYLHFLDEETQSPSPWPVEFYRCKPAREELVCTSPFLSRGKETVQIPTSIFANLLECHHTLCSFG